MKKDIFKTKQFVEHKRAGIIGAIITIAITLFLIIRAIYRFIVNGGGYDPSHIALIFVSLIAPAVVLFLHKTMKMTKITKLCVWSYPYVTGLLVVIGVIIDFNLVIESGFIKSYAVPFCAIYAIYLVACLIVQNISPKNDDDEE